uniref:hypothetical protein n=1 Tax=Acetatifactor sp. TaxID=1872090 RepID=UPI00405665AF
MIRAKEIYNDTSGQEFISMDYLRANAIKYLNTLALKLAHETKEGLRIAEDTFHALNGVAHGYLCIGLLTDEEVDTFIDGVIYAKFEKEEYRAMMGTSGRTFILPLH